MRSLKRRKLCESLASENCKQIFYFSWQSSTPLRSNICEEAERGSHTKILSARKRSKGSDELEDTASSVIEIEHQSIGQSDPISLMIQEGHVFEFLSTNYSGHAWSAKFGASKDVRIMTTRKNRLVFKLHASRSNGVYQMELDTSPGVYLCVSEEGSLALDSYGKEQRFLFTIEVFDDENKSLMNVKVRPALFPKTYVRHSNYLLRADVESGVSFESDSTWLLHAIPKKIPCALFDASSFVRRHHFVVEPLGGETENAHGILCNFAENCFGEMTTLRRRVGTESSHAVVFQLQGAGGMASAAAFDVASPFPLNKGMQERIERCIALKKRGGINKFVKAPENVAEILKKLTQVARAESRRFFTGVRKFELGFCEFIYLPANMEISPHIDGGNDCDWAAVFSIKGSSQVTVAGDSFYLQPGNMYLFQPQKYMHSVAPPTEQRLVVTLRFFWASSAVNQL